MADDGEPKSTVRWWGRAVTNGDVVIFVSTWAFLDYAWAIIKRTCPYLQ